ncbi:hypothetical protein QHF85_42585 [Polyangium sp. 6x1]|nr:hypothetical protein [Polyangium sp. 6x1]
MLHHRLDFEADRSLPAACNQPGDFRTALTSWVRPSVLDPAAARVLEVRVKRLPDGGKSAKVTIKSSTGEALGEAGHDYSPTTECFKILFWSAFDAATLMGAFVPPEPPPPAPPAAVPEPKPCPVCETPKPPPPAPSPSPVAVPRRYFVGLGPAATYNLAPEAAIGPQFLVGRRWGAFVAELYLRWMPLWRTRPVGLTEVQVHVTSATAAGCLRRGPVMACGLLATGAIQATALNATHADSGLSGFLGAGLRGAVAAPIFGPLSLRLDLEGVWNILPPTIVARRPEFWRPFPVSLGVGSSIVWALP